MPEHNNIVYDNKSTYSGIKGKLIISFMNLIHKSVHKQFTKIMDVSDNDSILDVGCGGGSLIKQIKAKTDKKVCGIDYSKDMVLACIDNNKNHVENNMVEVLEASVSSIPYQDNSFDKISVFETIQFWPDIQNDLKEVLRVLMPSGNLYLMNRLAKEGSKWYDWSKLKNADAYKSALESAGFCNINVDTTAKNGWIIVNASKKTI